MSANTRPLSLNRSIVNVVLYVHIILRADRAGRGRLLLEMPGSWRAEYICDTVSEGRGVQFAGYCDKTIRGSTARRTILIVERAKGFCYTSQAQRSVFLGNALPHHLCQIIPPNLHLGQTCPEYYEPLRPLRSSLIGPLATIHESPRLSLPR